MDTRSRRILGIAIIAIAGAVIFWDAYRLEISGARLTVGGFEIRFLAYALVGFGVWVAGAGRKRRPPASS